MSYDLIIIGGGPTGLSCGIAAHNAGLNYLIIEKGVLVNSIFRFPSNMTFFSTSKLLEIGDIPFISHVEKPTRKEALEYYRRIAQSYQMPIKLYEKVTSVDREADDILSIETDKATYKAAHVLVTTGFYDLPNLMHVPGEDLPKVKHYYDEAHHYVGQKLIVVGAANSACDVALETWQKGAEVTMVIRSDKIYDRVKYWIKPNIENRIREGSIKALFNSVIREIKERSVIIKGPDGELSDIENDFVLAMTGYKPDFEFITSMGIQLSEDEYNTPVYNPDTLETNVKDVYLAGVVNGGLKTNKFFIENTRDHGDMIIKDILSKKKRATGS